MTNNISAHTTQKHFGILFQALFTMQHHWQTAIATYYIGWSYIHISSYTCILKKCLTEAQGEGKGEGAYVFLLLCVVCLNGFTLSSQGQSDIGITRERKRERERKVVVAVHIQCRRKYDEFMCAFEEGCECIYTHY